MGQVIALGIQLGKTSRMIADALEAERTTERPVVILAPKDSRKEDLVRQLQCMNGMMPTRIQIKTWDEWSAERLLPADD